MVQLNTVSFRGTIADRCVKGLCSLMEFAFIHRQNKVINLGKCYCNTEYIVLNLLQLLSACLQSRYFDQMQYFMLSIENLSSVSLCFDRSQPHEL